MMTWSCTLSYMKRIFHSNDHQFICLISTIHSNEHNFICMIGVHISLMIKSTVHTKYLRQWLKFSCMKPCRIHVWIIHDMIYTQWLCMIIDHIHSYHGMNLAIIELWSLINDAFSTSYQRKTNQVTDHFW